MATKTKTVLNILSIFTLGLGYLVEANAYCVGILGNYGPTGIATASTSAFQYDTYATVCPATTSYFVARISRKSGTATLNLEVGKGGFASVTTSDTSTTAGTQCDGVVNEYIGSGAGAFTPKLFGGSGQYNMIVAKDGPASNYALEFSCYNASNIELTVGGGPSGSGEVDRLMNH